jgi:protein involved in polysaccharide export with SLBB domain
MPLEQRLDISVWLQGERTPSLFTRRKVSNCDGLLTLILSFPLMAFIMRRFILPTMSRFSNPAPILLAAALCLTACATVKRFTPDLSKLPRPAMPSFASLKKLTNIIPGMPDSDQATEEDPQMPFNARGTLGYGHTLRIHVYEGARTPKRIYNEVLMVDTQGVIAFGEIGSAKIGGNTLPQAVENIAATFRIGLRLTRPVTVHIISVEDTPLVSIRGDVIKDEFIPAWEDMTIKQAVTVSGGRQIGSKSHGVYLIREGVRRYFSQLDDADQEEPEPGDIIELSPDI